MWYRKRHIALMDGMQYDIEANPKPPKDFDERLEQARRSLIKTGEAAKVQLAQLGQTLKGQGAVIKENSAVAG